MAKPRPDEVDEELQKQDDEVYGTDYTDGGEKFHDTEDMVKEVTGDDPDEEQDGFSIAEEVEKDEEAVEDGADTPGYPLDDEEPESDLEKIEKKEKYKEDSGDE